MHQRALSQLKIESALRRAVERNELRLHYQPIVELSAGGIVGFEALVRWEHPELGLLQPDAFLGVAEDIGIIPRLGDWVLNEACRQLSEWEGRSALALPLKVNVNLHALQLSRGTLVRSIERILQETGIAGERLNLELTEHAMMQESEGAITVLRRIRELGAGVCLDDFGTGYSSLSYLVRFPVTTLKIDRSFVGTIQRGESMAIIETIRSLARTLSMEVVAEGVETQDQLDTLRSIGCGCAQGYLFSRPLRPEKAEEMLLGAIPWAGYFHSNGQPPG
jgi:Amt family ammonium transporter